MSMKERLEAIIKRARSSGQSEARLIASEVTDILDDPQLADDEDHFIASMNEVISWADAFIKAAIGDPLVCKECGSRDVVQGLWTDVNGYRIRELEDLFPPCDEQHCVTCKQDVPLVSLTEFERRRLEALKPDPRRYCVHEPDFTTVRHADGTLNVADLMCKKCGLSGSFAIPDDVNWE